MAKFRNREATINFKRYEAKPGEDHIEIPDEVLPKKDGKPDMDYIKEKMHLRPIADTQTPKDKVKDGQ